MATNYYTNWARKPLPHYAHPLENNRYIPNAKDTVSDRDHTVKAFLGGYSADELSTIYPNLPTYTTLGTTPVNFKLNLTVPSHTQTWVTYTTFPTITAYSAFCHAPYGVLLRLARSAGLGTYLIVIKGRDYLGQPVIESVYLTDTTPSYTAKAFAYIDNMYTNATVDNIGIKPFGFGLPYKTSALLSLMASSHYPTFSERTDITSFFSLQAPGLTSLPTSADPRGALTAGGVSFYIHNVEATLVISDSITSGVGGLYGVKHYGL